MKLSAVVEEFKSLFTTQDLRADFIAGLSLAVLAIPLALAIGYASLVPVNMSLIAVVVGGLVAAIFGGSRLSVSGPALSMTVLISQSVEAHGLACLLVIGLICGVLQLLAGAFKLGRYVKFVPLPVLWAFIAGIGVTVILNALPSALGLHLHEFSHEADLIRNIAATLHQFSLSALSLALGTIILISVLSRYFKKIPAFLVAIFIPSLIVYLLGISNVTFLSDFPNRINLLALPDFSTIHNWYALFMSAVAIFILASLETLLSTSAIDKMTNAKIVHNPNQELIGQGLANSLVAIFGGIPVAALLIRSTVNIQAGAKTRRASIFHALIVLGIIYFASGLMTKIPVPVLAGVLISISLSMINFKHALLFWQRAKTDFIVYLVTFILVVLTNLVEGVQTGITLALVILIIRMFSLKSNVRVWENNRVMRISLSGNISFLSSEKLEEFKRQILAQGSLAFVVFECDRLQHIDSAGGEHILALVKDLNVVGIKVILHGLTKEQYKLLCLLNSNGEEFFNTVSESEIKQILENAGIEHSANEILKQGMEKFHEQFTKDRSKLLSTLAKGQSPHTLLITCSDSRLNPNEFFSVNLGELFVIRNVGNVVPNYQDNSQHSEAAAIEYAIAALKIKNIIICAHTECGAIKASIKHPEDSSGSGLDNWLQIIKNGFKANLPQNGDDGTRINLLNQIEHLKTYPLVAELIAQNQVTISAWVYDVHSAQMLEWSEIEHKLIPLIKSINVAN